jgi:hypothetical protein
MADKVQAPAETGSYGLRREVLSPMETLAQSVSTIAPTTTPAATIPMVCALAGNGTWLAYVLSTVAVLLVALCVSKFARYSASPGLCTYASMILPPSPGATAAWSLLLAYVATGASLIGGFYHYGNLLLRDAIGHGTSAVILALLVDGDRHLDCWARREDLGAPDALDRSDFCFGYRDCCDPGSHSAWLGLGYGAASTARDEPQRGSAGTGFGVVQFCWIRKRYDTWHRSQQSAEDHSARSDSERASGWGYVHGVRLRRSAWIPYRRAELGN